MRSITLPQALILVTCVVVPLAAYKLLGSPEAAGASMIAGMVVNFLLGRADPPDPPPDPPSTGGKVIGFISGAAAMLCLSACFVPVEPSDPTDALSKCAAEARAAYYVGHVSEDDAMAIYQACKARAGIL